ncbi:Aromatic-L-amino-acid/L-histidine decarboxylase [Ceraceosorus bombacis]|uniref:Aromatic-L-amino-acid/L-histidine decarboxylase n=1 Tax=Ceraceosorus bombacis TaxID=401625 RepID=A0A0P1BNE0_9BASI|nr:Aromatic-L-amino-acid/L-histidine decarboxylase [Ceraceosorus bombacis]
MSRSKASNASGAIEIQEWSLAEHGIGPDTPAVNIFTALPHNSIAKAAAITGIGRQRIVDVSRRSRAADEGQTDQKVQRCQAQKEAACLEVDLERLEDALRKAQRAEQGAIVVIGMGEVNTGALCGQLRDIRILCDEYHAWLHVDAAFAAFACLVPGFEWVSSDLDLADSITSDAHKQLNVPYDCGLFYSRRKTAAGAVSALIEHASQSPIDAVFGPGAGPKPAYLVGSSTSTSEAEDSRMLSEAEQRRQYAMSQPSPLFRNIENSRRFRALPLYTALLSQGRSGYVALVKRNVEFAKRLRRWLRLHQAFEVLTPAPDDKLTPQDASRASRVPWALDEWGYNIVLFRASQACPNARLAGAEGAGRLVEAIKKTGKMYVSGTSWNGKGAVRIAVSSWLTGLDKDRKESDDDFNIVTSTLEEVIRQ